ncbi:AGAP006874-PA-like protein [Anopheles sinensis]|uniref:AGAP006874-PA-like protein n=1 Tax=Anopheles sinensis TaxID=74873 RepID=A0A084W696_ANOSI|nr:AGAP006874-PA-like protein [Anopheles sinensis]
MDRIQNELHLYYRVLLTDTFRTVIKISQWFFTAPYPLYPYQHVTSIYQQRLYVLGKILFSALVFGAITAAPVLLYFMQDKAIFIYSVPVFIKMMYFIQTTLNIAGMGYVVFVYQFRTSFHRFYFDRLLHVLEQFGRRDIDVGLHQVKRAVRIVMLLTPVQIGMVGLMLLLRISDWGQLPRFLTFVAAHILGRSTTWVYMTIMGTVAILLRQMNDTLESFIIPPSDAHEALSAEVPQPTRLTAVDRRMIEKIRLLQLELMRVVEKINGGEFGTLLIIYIVVTFIYINIELLQLYQGKRQNTIPSDIFYIRLINCAFRFAGFIMFAYSNRLVQKQNYRVCSILHQLNKVDNEAACSNIFADAYKKD